MRRRITFAVLLITALAIYVTLRLSTEEQQPKPGRIVNEAYEYARRAGPPGSTAFTVAFRKRVAEQAGQREFAALDSRPIEGNPTFRENVAKGAKPPVNDDICVFEGVPVMTNDFDNAVAVLSVGGSVECSGFAIEPRKIVTAEHCITGAAQVSEGNAVTKAGLRNVTGRARFAGADVGLLFLDNDVTMLSDPIATTAEIDGASLLRIVGFGKTEVGTKSKKVYADVGIATWRCDKPNEMTTFGCIAPNEMVADDKTHHADSCEGDSGGPAFVKTSTGRAIGAIVKKSALGRNCIDGSIYVRLDTKGLDDFFKNAKPE
jgi:hypothetical protein